MALADYMRLANELQHCCSQMNHLRGLKKLERRILTEINFFMTLEDKDEEVQRASLQSSNLGHFAAVFHAATHLPGVVGVMQPFTSTCRQQSLFVDVVALQGRAWVKVIARKGQALHQVWAGRGQFGERDMVQQLCEYTASARHHPVNFCSPHVHAAFYNTVTSPMAAALRAEDVGVWGHEVPVSALVRRLLKAVQHNRTDDDNEADDCAAFDEDSNGLVALGDVYDGKEQDISGSEILTRSLKGDKEELEVATSLFLDCDLESDDLQTDSADLEVAKSTWLPSTVHCTPAASKLTAEADLSRLSADASGTLSTQAPSPHCGDIFSPALTSSVRRSDVWGNADVPGKTYEMEGASPTNVTSLVFGPLLADLSDDSPKSRDFVQSPQGWTLTAPSRQCLSKIIFSCPQFSSSLSEPAVVGSSGAGKGVRTCEGRGGGNVEAVNLDITTLISLVSAVCHGGCHLRFIDKVIDQQAAEERESPSLPELQKYLQGKNLLVCRTAWADFNSIVRLLGGPKEKERAAKLIDRVTIVDDHLSERANKLQLRGKIKERSKVVFGTGDHLQAITVTANCGFVRAAVSQGVHLTVHLHPARALTEQKESTAFPLKGIHFIPDAPSTHHQPISQSPSRG